jgi:hypothetical protein
MGFKKQIIFYVSFFNHADVLILMGKLDFQCESTTNYGLVSVLYVQPLTDF